MKSDDHNTPGLSEDTMGQCRVCGELVPLSTQFCPRCGARLGQGVSGTQRRQDTIEWVCPHCAKKNREDYLYCTRCGKRRTYDYGCRFCGKGLPWDAEFCPYCGKRNRILPDPHRMQPLYGCPPPKLPRSEAPLTADVRVVRYEEE